MENNVVTSVMEILGYPQKLKSNDRACGEVNKNVFTKNEESLNKSALLQQRMKSKKNANSYALFGAHIDPMQAGLIIRAYKKATQE